MEGLLGYNHIAYLITTNEDHCPAPHPRLHCFLLRGRPAQPLDLRLQDRGPQVELPDLRQHLLLRRIPQLLC